MSAALLLSLWLPRVADAHFDLLMPPPADTATDGGKGAPPCGPTSASNVVTAAQGGHPISISLNETVLHPGHYRAALSINSRSELPPDPMVVVDSGGYSISAAIESPAQFPVLADDLFDHISGTIPIPFQTTLTLPNVTCDKCTLQIIEFMAQHGPNPGGGYYYHHCADLKITADPALPPADLGTGGAPAGGTGGAGGQPASTGGGGCAIVGARACGGASGALVGLAAIALAYLRRRRRRAG
jgi:hypothetical protein